MLECLLVVKAGIADALAGIEEVLEGVVGTVIELVDKFPEDVKVAADTVEKRRSSVREIGTEGRIS